MLGHALDDQIRQTYLIDEETYPDHVIVDVQLAEGVLHMVMQRKRLFSSTVYVFVLWMIGTAMILVGIASIFMRNQVKPIRRLAVAADNFGKGRDVVRFKPEGAKEVRQAASAFMAMRERIMRQISQRTEMLAGVSHDLRTPLTRMKLQLAMAGDAEGVQDLKSDVEEMEHMLESYLAFARGEGAEAPEPTDLTALLNEVVAQARRSGAPLDIHAEGDFTLPLRPKAVKRALTNLVDNAVRYAGHVAVRLGRREDAIEVMVDDDGPGIPAEKREDVFKAFYRLDASRNPVTGGTGLGLTIVRDIVRGHGGDVVLEDSPLGGLRVRAWFPL